jgi:hypothetical protein
VYRYRQGYNFIIIASNNNQFISKFRLRNDVFQIKRRDVIRDLEQHDRALGWMELGVKYAIDKGKASKRIHYEMITVHYPSHVYAGESLTCTIIFSPKNKLSKQLLRSNSDLSLTFDIPSDHLYQRQTLTKYIHYSFVQLSGVVWLDPDTFRTAALEELRPKNNTVSIITTDPSVLCSDTLLNTALPFRYNVTFPKDIPPSCIGKSLKISYRLVIGLLIDNPLSKPALYHIPIRIFNKVERTTTHVNLSNRIPSNLQHTKSISTQRCCQSRALGPCH